MLQKNKNLIKNIYLLIILVASDQLIKLLVENYLTYHKPLNILPFFSLLKTYNTGIAFSFLQNIPSLTLLIISIITCLFFCYLWYTTNKTHKWQKLAYLLIIAGALGNMIDRLSKGYVVDYLYLHSNTYNFSFAVFNLADSFITIGAIILIANELINIRKKE
ncbi:signal peptidase II [Bartonella sp. DGB1]|uniref:signal peptidase II n=1 Tax=Bartonella sp. DGB1 TaxID=3239807 RepID=UPI00352607C2